MGFFKKGCLNFSPLSGNELQIIKCNKIFEIPCFNYLQWCHFLVNIYYESQEHINIIGKF